MTNPSSPLSSSSNKNGAEFIPAPQREHFHSNTAVSSASSCFNSSSSSEFKVTPLPIFRCLSSQSRISSFGGRSFQLTQFTSFFQPFVPSASTPTWRTIENRNSLFSSIFVASLLRGDRRIYTSWNDARTYLSVRSCTICPLLTTVSTQLTPA